MSPRLRESTLEVLVELAFFESTGSKSNWRLANWVTINCSLEISPIFQQLTQSATAKHTLTPSPIKGGGLAYACVIFKYPVIETVECKKRKL